MRHVRIVGGVSPTGITITDVDTGKQLDNVVQVDITLKADEMNSATLWTTDRPGHLEAEPVAVSVDVEAIAKTGRAHGETW